MERPIIFSGPMVRAILEGRKTQTRRIIKEPDSYGCLTGDCPHSSRSECAAAMVQFCPYGKPGDRLWVRETWTTDGCSEGLVAYRADGEPPQHINVKWKPSIHMPRWASRITLEITGVRVERLQDISEEDAKAEGAYPPLPGTDDDGCHFDGGTYRDGFYAIWQSINAKRHPWESNPWVWVISFKDASNA